MRRLILAATFLLVIQTAMANGKVRVITDRTENHLKPLFALFEKNTGIKVEAAYVDKGLMTRLKTNPTEADLVITKGALNLEIARKEGLLQACKSKVLDKLDKAFVDPDKTFVITSYRPRAIYYSKERVKLNQVATYMDLTKKEWKGKVLIRSGYHSYNIDLFCQMAASEGLEKTKEFIKGLKANLARTPTGNDRAQIKGIYEGKADLSIGNSYYMGIMMGRKDQRPWAEATGLIFPNQEEKGCYVMRSGAGLTKSDTNVENATKLLEFMLSDFGQYYLASSLYTYPVKKGIPISEFNKTLGEGQKGIKDGAFKSNFVSIREIEKQKEAVIKILNKVNFDK